MEYSSVKELIELACEHQTTIGEIVLAVEIEESELSRQVIIDKMYNNLQVMKESVEKGLSEVIKSSSGLSGGDARKILEYSNPLTGDVYQKVISYALAVSEVNAGMGKIVAGPTAGSSGIVPAVLLVIAEKLAIDDEKLVQALFTAAGLGTVVALNATLSGAAGGCQAECGAAAAMAAGAAVELAGGRPEVAAHAFALALKNMLGLVCDPVAGLVEVPCIKRNGFSAAHALTAANMALAGIESVIPPDEVIEAMFQIGGLMPGCLRETSQGGLAVTPTALRIKEKLLN